MTNALQLTPTAERILTTAERLLSEKGLGLVSTREIAREAGQKNHSAVSYHFGSLDNLVATILDYRMIPLNARRRKMLDTLVASNKQQDLRCLVQVIVEPFAEELLQPLEHSYYLSLLSQIVATGQWETLVTQLPHRSSAIMEAGELMLVVLRERHDETIAMERMQLMGLHIVSSITHWNSMRRRNELPIHAQDLHWRIENLIDYLVGALTHAPSS